MSSFVNLLGSLSCWHHSGETSIVGFMFGSNSVKQSFKICSTSLGEHCAGIHMPMFSEFVEFSLKIGMKLQNVATEQ